MGDRPDPEPEVVVLTKAGHRRGFKVAHMRSGWFVVDSDADVTAIQESCPHDSAELARKALDVLVCKAIADGWKRV
jgi:nitrite reductase/ring-hydroxylating ferredoxin subunit